MAPKRQPPPPPPRPDDRAWSSRTSIRSDQATRALVEFTALPAETGPTWAPDRLSLWPVEGGRYGIDAHYHGETGAERAEQQRLRLAAANLATVTQALPDGGCTLRLGPLAHSAVWLALEAFLGRPLPGD